MITRNWQEEYDGRVAWIRDLVHSAGAKGIVKGIVFGNSGGKDSALVGILCKAACDNTVGIIMPCASRRNYGSDAEDGRELAIQYGIETRTVDLTAVRAAELEALKGVCRIEYCPAPAHDDALCRCRCRGPSGRRDRQPQ